MIKTSAFAAAETAVAVAIASDAAAVYFGPAPGASVQHGHQAPNTVLPCSSSFSLMLFIFAITRLRYRRKWVFWFSCIYGGCLACLVPLGTPFGLFPLIYALIHRREFVPSTSALAISQHEAAGSRVASERGLQACSHQGLEQNGCGQRLEGYLSFQQRISLAVA